MISIAHAKNIKCIYDKKTDAFICDFPEYWEFGDLLKKINIHGTEYFDFEPITIFLQLIYNDTVKDNALCILSMFYNNGTRILEMPCINVEGYGLYYLNLPPYSEGVYLLSAVCYWEYSKVYFYPTSYIVNQGSLAGNINDLRAIDGKKVDLKEANDDFDVEFVFQITETLINLSQASILSVVHFKGTGENVLYWIYNFENQSWELLENYAPPSPNWITVNNLIYNISRYINDSQMKLRFNTSSPSAGKLDDVFSIDYLAIEASNLTSVIVDSIRGGGEVHVHNPKRIFAEFDKASNLITEIILSNSDYCEENNLVKEILIRKCIDDICYNYTKYETITCPYGCADNKCRSSPFENYLILIGIIALVIFIIYVIQVTRS